MMKNFWKEGTFESMDYRYYYLLNIGEALRNKPAGKIPLIIFESTLTPTTMDTLIREHFQKYSLEEGKDILLGNSPNRAMQR